MRKKKITGIFIASLIIVILGILLLIKNYKIKEKNKLVIIDATYSCVKIPELFYEDDTNKYYFTCKKANSMYVKLKTGDKMLIKDALENKNVTIEELISSGLDVIKENK